MKYAEGPTVEVEAAINAPADRVWKLISDVDMPARFSSEFQGAEWVDGAGGPVVGARFRGRQHHASGREWESVSTITEMEPRRVFAWTVGDTGNPSAVWRFEIVARAAGSVSLRHWFRMGPGPSGLTAVIESMPDREDAIVARRCHEHEDNMRRVVDGIKAIAEEG